MRISLTIGIPILVPSGNEINPLKKNSPSAGDRLTQSFGINRFTASFLVWEECRDWGKAIVCARYFGNAGKVETPTVFWGRLYLTSVKLRGKRRLGDG